RDVLLHRGEAHRVGLREPRDRRLVCCAAAKDVATGRVGQGTEDLVDDLGRDLIYNHIVVGYLQIGQGDLSPHGAPYEKGTATMKLTTNTQVSVDGVMQANGGRNEKLDPGMERGGWARPLFDDEAMAFVQDVYQRADAFLFGRRTYELFAGYWGARSGDPISDALNARPKYVASTTLTDPRWANTTVLSGDVA